jgi:SpoVK/Ycf46/Vps4 family AAA+-type ATPase
VRLASDVQSVVDMTKSNPGMEGLFQALLVVLENASDKSIIAMALAQLDPNHITNAALRKRAAKLLTDCNLVADSEKWHTPLPVDDNENIVQFRKPGSEEPPRATGSGFSFADIGGLENVKEQVRRKIIKPFQTPDLFQTFKRRSGGGVLMYGPPGCGKTMLARAMTTECRARFVIVKAAEVLDMYVGVAEKRIANIFAEARLNKPTVLFLDEVEALAQRRQYNAHHNYSTLVSALLEEMDGVQRTNEGILVLAATNVPWSIDAAFRRPGRFDRTLFVPPPDKIARRFILNNLLNQRPFSQDLNRDTIVERTSAFSGADLSNLLETAADFAIEESEQAGKIVPLNDRHFREAFNEVRSTTGEWLSLARNHAEHTQDDGLYEDFKEFLKQHSR